MMVRIQALMVLTICVVGALCLRGAFRESGSEDGGAPALEVKHRYLVVSIEGPADWVKQHQFSIRWQGKTVSLPVAFRIPGPGDKVKLGAGPEREKYLIIGNQEVPVTAKPETQFRVGNELGFAFHPEESHRKGVVAFSLANWVVVCPRDQPGEVSPDADNKEIKRVGNIVEERLQKLLAEKRVIDVKPEMENKAEPGTPADRPRD
jgi:hypothetical protein